MNGRYPYRNVLSGGPFGEATWDQESPLPPLLELVKPRRIVVGADGSLRAQGEVVHRYSVCDVKRVNERTVVSYSYEGTT